MSLCSDGIASVQRDTPEELTDEERAKFVGVETRSVQRLGVRSASAFAGELPLDWVSWRVVDVPSR